MPPSGVPPASMAPVAPVSMTPVSVPPVSVPPVVAPTPENIWFSEILNTFWPRIITFFGEQSKASLIKLAKNLPFQVPQSVFQGVDQLMAGLAESPLVLPVRISFINKVIKDAWCFLHPLVQQITNEVVVANVRKAL